MSPAAVSVVIPCYNDAEFLGDAVASAQTQTLAPAEIIIVDDGSTDETPDVVAALRAEDSRIVGIRQANRGLPAARNAGARAATGSYLAFLDADDTLLPDKLSIQVDFLETRSDVGLVGGHFQRMTRDGTPLGGPLESTWKDEDLGLDAVALACPFATHTMLLRKSWFDRIGGYDESLPAAEDWDLYLRLAMAGCRIHRLARVVCHYRTVADAMSMQGRRQTEAMLRVVDQSFANPAFPAALQSLEPRVRHETYLKGMARCYATGDMESASDYLSRALVLQSVHPELDRDASVSHLRLMVPYLGIEDVAGYYRRILAHLPEAGAGVGEIRRALRGFLLEAQVRESRLQGARLAMIAAAARYLLLAPLHCLRFLLLPALGRRDDSWRREAQHP